MMRLLHYIRIMLFLLLPVQVAAQPVSLQRVLSISHYSYTNNELQSLDSISCKYSANRGSFFRALDFYPIPYGTAYGFSDMAFTAYLNVHHYNAEIVHPLNGIHNLGIEYDTLLKYNYENSPTGTWSGGLSNIYTKLHDGHQLLAAYRDSNWKIICNKGIQPDIIYFINPVIGDTQQKKIKYNNSGNPISDTITYFLKGMGVTSTQWRRYTYGHNNQLRVMDYWSQAQSLPAYSYREVMDYNSSGLLQRISTNYTGVDTAYTFVYDANNRLTETYEHARGKKLLLVSQHYNDKGEVDTLTRLAYDHMNLSLDTLFVLETIFFYNEFHNPDSAVSFYRLRSNSDAAVYRTYYKYETYIRDTIINDAPEIFPNPARKSFSIRWNNAKPGNPVYILLYSTAGQTVLKQYTEQPQDVDTIQIPALSAGCYFIHVLASGGRTLFTSKLVVE